LITRIRQLQGNALCEKDARKDTQGGWGNCSTSAKLQGQKKKKNRVASQLLRAGAASCHGIQKRKEEFKTRGKGDYEKISENEPAGGAGGTKIRNTKKGDEKKELYSEKEGGRSRFDGGGTSVTRRETKPWSLGEPRWEYTGRRIAQARRRSFLPFLGKKESGKKRKSKRRTRCTTKAACPRGDASILTWAKKGKFFGRGGPIVLAPKEIKGAPSV